MALNRTLSIVALFFVSFVLTLKLSLKKEDSADFSSFLGPSWLIIGDSHTVGGFGEGLRAGLVRELNNSNLHIYAATGSRFEHWSTGKWQDLHLGSLEYTPQKNRTKYKGYVNPYWNFDAFLEKSNASHVVIALGTNDMALYYQKHKKFFQGVLKDEYFDKIKKYLSEKKIKDCYWVIPTYVNDKLFPRLFQDLFYAQLTTAVQPYCQVVDSRKITFPNQETKLLYPTSKDKIHYLKKDGEYWGESVAKLISQSQGN